MEFVPETSVESDEPATIRPALKQSRLSKFGIVKKNPILHSQKAIIPADKGKHKMISIDSQSESDSDFVAIGPATEKTSTGRRNRRAGKNDKTRAVVANRKRPRKPIWSDQGDSEGPTKGMKGHKSNPQTSSYKQWDLMWSGVPFGSQIESYNNESTIVDINDVLNKEQKDLFRLTCFGKFLDLQNFKVQGQIVHNILFREVAQSRNDELWVDLGGKIMRFGIQEFSFITGLQCGESCNKATVEPVSGGTFDKYFARFVPLTRQVIHHRFITRGFENDEDAVKIASLHLILNFLLGAPMTNIVHRSYVDLLDTSRANQYPWGKEAYNFTIQHLKGYAKDHIAADNYKKRVIRMRGFIISLQFWFYEVCSVANGIACLPQGLSTPRMLKWRCIGEHTNKDIKENFLSLPQSKFNNIIPTTEERNVLGFADYFKDPNQLVRNSSNRRSPLPDTDSDFLSRLDRISTEQGEFKLMFTKFVFDVMTMLQKIHNTIQTTGNHRDASNDDLDYDPIQVPTQMFDEIIRSATKGVKENEKVAHPTHAIWTTQVVGNSSRTVEHQEIDKSFMPSFDAILDGLPSTQLIGSKHNIVSDKVAREPISLTVGTSVLTHLNINAEKNDNVSAWEMAANIKHKWMDSRKLRYGCSPLDDFSWDFIATDQAKEFDAWLQKGFLVHPRLTGSGLVYYRSRSDIIRPPFDYNVERVSTKNWFITLDRPGKMLDDSHVNTIFYYLRKIPFYSDEAVPYNSTTTDVLFHDTISRLYREYVSNPSDVTIINTLSPVIDYMFGYNIACGTPWVEVDDILFPIRVPKGSVRWVLGRLSVHDGQIWVYNAVTDPDVVHNVDEAVKPYSILLPIFLDLVGFYKVRTNINLRRAGYKAKRLIDPFEVIVAENIPRPKPGDCGIHMVTFAESFITDIDYKQIIVETARKRLAWTLWNHGMMKLGDSYNSEEESAGTLPDDIREKNFTG